MDDAMIQELLEAAKPDVIRSLKEQLTSRVSYEAVSRAQQEIVDHTVAWVKAEILPEITKQLIESKDGLIAVGAKVAVGSVEAVAESMIKTIKTNLESSWNKKAIFEALLK